MKAVEFSIPWIVQPKQSTRFTRLGRAYTPKKVVDDAAALAALFAPYVPKRPLVGPVHLILVFRYPWRQSESQRWRKRGRRWKGTNPDTENLTKQVCDVLESCGFVTNDAQVAWLEVNKEWRDVAALTVHLKELE